MDMLFEVRVGGIGHVKQQVGILQFLKGGLERGHEFRRQVPYKANGVGDDDRAFAGEPEPATGGVERREQLVFDGDVAVCERIKKG